MKVKIIQNYTDKNLNKLVKKDDVLTVTAERAKELINARVAEVIKEEIEVAVVKVEKETAVKPVKKITKKKTNAKK